MYSAQIEKAIQAACVLHDGQVRKGAVPMPYVSHVFSVFQLVSDYTDDEATQIAALLHDTLEDTDYTAAALEEDFGSNVRDIVLALSEDKTIGDWNQRKKVYLESVVTGGETALLISAADKIHNMRSMIEQYHDDVPSYIASFNRYRTNGQAFLIELGEALQTNLPNEIVTEYQHVLSEFTKFNEYVESVTEQA